MTESTEYGLSFGFQLLVFHKCSSILDTMELLKVMATKISEYREETGKEKDASRPQ